MTTINIDEGKYAIKLQAMKKDEDEPSAMGTYLSNSATVTKEADSVTLTITLLDDKIITGFQVNDHAGEEITASDKKVDDEANTRDEMFKLDQLTTPLHVRVQYEVEYEGQVMKGDEELRLVFDEASLEKVN